ncbi:MAG TPA: FAD-dependent monooxygenase, partial [Hyphomonas sp.]|nr:FAD-dependent monooxygenase [Hyphomonas sp.]
MSAMMSIAIAGAGVGGLASGILLARAGHRVTVFDQFEAAGPVGSGLMLQETGLTILGALGLRTGAEALGSPIARLWGVSSETGRAVLDVRYGALRKSLVGIGIQRAALFDLLFDAAKAAGVRVVLGTRIVSADTAAGLFRDAEGSAHGPFNLLIDCMGVRSPLASKPSMELPYGALWATLP